MKSNPKEGVSKNLVPKIVIPIMILVVIVGIWFFKNADQAPDAAAVITEINEVNPDFVLEVTAAFNLEQLKSYGLPIVIDFGADTCIPCKEMAPVLVKLNEELQGRAIIKFVDVWKYQELAEGYPISVIPTQIFFDKDGKPYIPLEPQTAQMIMYSTKDTNEHVFTAHEGGMTEEKLLAALIEMGLEE